MRASQPASPPGMACAWPTQLSAQTDNTAFPDSAAVYWGQPIVASAGNRIVLSGRVPGVTFLPFSTTQASRLYLLGLRNILVSSSFARSPEAVTRASDPAAAAAAMGAYYPRATVCSLKTLTVHGPQGCER